MLGLRNGWPLLGCLWLLAIYASSLQADDSNEQVWRTSTFADFVKGTFSDGGVNTYVAADGTVRLINLRDLNADGQIDIVMPNTHDNNAKVDLLIHWGESQFSKDARTQLPTDGGKKSAAADLNGDGHLDLVVANFYNGTKNELNLFIYWASADGFDAQRRAELPSQGAAAVVARDLNRDGYPELIVANSGLTFHVALDNFQKSYLYWGSAEGYSEQRRSELKTIHASDVEAADLNGDGFVDIVFANEGNTAAQSGALIYWGNAKSEYSEQSSLHLPGEHSSAVAVADLNRDGIPEIVLANAFRLHGRESDVYNLVDTTAINSFVYWGSTEGHSPQRRTELPTAKANGVAVADFNSDGWPDLAFANGAERSSFVYWGSEQGFDAEQRLVLPTLDAADCASADLNKDGHIDLVFANVSNGRRKAADSFIYWGSPAGPSVDRKTNIPTWGATGVTVADLDGHGKLDLVFTHEEDGTADNEIDSWVYFGDSNQSYSPDRRLALPTKGTYGYTAADLNHDGHVDLYFSGEESRIYRGRPEGLATDDPTVLTKRFAFSAVAADFNRDGWLDLSLSEWWPGVDDTSLYWGGPGGFSQDNRFVFQVDSSGRLTQHTLADLDKNGWLDLILPTWTGMIIFWNDAEGFDNSRQTVLPTAGAVACEVADLNGDGFLDIVVANLFDRKATGEGFRAFGGTPKGDTYIYWGSEQGYQPDHRLILPSVGNEGIAVADLNSDGYPDVVLSSYHGGDIRSHPSYVYWNSATGFDPERVTLLPTDSASGVMVADFNRDGHRDILFACHKLDGDHRCDSFLYWGSPQGFWPERRSQLPGLGPHFLTAVDAGEVYQRGDCYDYLSPPFDAGAEARFETISWEASTPFATDVQFQIRTAATERELLSAAWRGPNGPETKFQVSPAKIERVPDGHRWIQYKASLISPDSVSSPVLRAVSIHFRKPINPSDSSK